MKKTGISLENVKINNKSAILDVLNKKGAMSRKDIANELGLTPAAVTMLCAELMERNILLEKGEMQEEKRVGRRKVSIDINYDYRCIAAVSIEVLTTYITIVNLKGKMIDQKIIDTESSIEPERFLEKIAGECKVLLWENEKKPSDVLGIGVCIPGIVNRKEGASVNAYGIWNNVVPVRELMVRFMNCPVVVENNIKSFAEGELLYGMGKTGADLLFVKWGPGVGSAIVIGNQVYEGFDNKAAEIGHYILETGEKRCKCGRRGCLETEVSITAITDKIKQIYSKESTPQLYAMTKGEIDSVTGQFFFKWMHSITDDEASNLDRAVEEVIYECIDVLARVVTNVITILAPNNTILFGCMLENNNFRKQFVKLCKKYDERYDETYISKSVLSNKISYIGPSTLIAREEFFLPGGC